MGRNPYKRTLQESIKGQDMCGYSLFWLALIWGKAHWLVILWVERYTYLYNTLIYTIFHYSLLKQNKQPFQMNRNEMTIFTGEITTAWVVLWLSFILQASKHKESTFTFDKTLVWIWEYYNVTDKDSQKQNKL